MPIFVRRAGEEALDTLTSLEAAIFPDHWSRNAIASHLASETGVAFLATTTEGEPIGYLLGLCMDEEAELLRIGVLTEQRGCGVGFWILDAFLFDIKHRGVEACFLEVREGNYDAIALYEKFDFTVSGRRKNYYKNPTEDAILMALRPV